MSRLTGLLVFTGLWVFASATAQAQPKANDGGPDPRVVVVATLATYGTVGGALLGAASLPYGTGTRAIAMGASLGLYAGILFGAYVVVSHHYARQAAANELAPEVAPAGGEAEGGGLFGGGLFGGDEGEGLEDGEGEAAQRLRAFRPLDLDLQGELGVNGTPQQWAPNFMIPLFRIEF